MDQFSTSERMKVKSSDNDAVEEVELEYEEETSFIPSSSPRTPELKTFIKFRDRNGRQTCSTPCRTPRLCLITEEDIDATLLSDVESSIHQEELIIDDDLTKPTKKTFQLFLACASLFFFIGFICGFYIVTPKITTSVQELPSQTSPFDEAQAVDSKKTIIVHTSLPTSYTVDNIAKWTVANIGAITDKHRYIVSQLCISGSSCDNDLANHIATKWQTYGIEDVSLETFDVLLSYPDMSKLSSIRVLDSQGNTTFYKELYGLRADTDGMISIATNSSQFVNTSLSELASHQDADNVTSVNEVAVEPHWPLPAFIPYSKSGIVQGELVYVHFGTQEDFNTITKMGIDTRAKIALIQRGFITIQNKILNAEKNGIVALLLYHDPANDAKFPTIPATYDITGIMGDPLTPSTPAMAGVYRLTEEETSYPMIPVHVIEANISQSLLDNLKGKKAPNDWQGGFNTTYHVGKKRKSQTIVEVELFNKMEVTPISNIIATIKGKTYPDEIVLIGSHRTAFPDDIRAAVNSVSLVTELASVIGKLIQDGWQPERTIMLCSWAAKEYGFSGSVEWMQKHKFENLEDVVAYVDVNAQSGDGQSLYVTASPLLGNLVVDSAQKLSFSVNPQNASLVMDGDHVGFAHHLGIPSISILTASLPNEHIDKRYTSGILATTQFLVHVTMVLSGVKVLPFNAITLAECVAKYYRNLETQFGDSLLEVDVTLDFLKESVEELSSLANLFQKRQMMAADIVTIDKVNRKFKKLCKAFVNEKSKGFNRNLLLGVKNSYQTFPGLEELLSSPDVSPEQVKKQLSELLLAVRLATAALS